MHRARRPCAAFFSWARPSPTGVKDGTGELGPADALTHIAQTERLTVGQIPAWVDDMVR